MEEHQHIEVEQQDIDRQQQPQIERQQQPQIEWQQQQPQIEWQQQQQQQQPQIERLQQQPQIEWQQQLQGEQQQLQEEQQFAEVEEEMQLLQQHSQRMAEQQAAEMPEEIKAVKNPVSPYMMFAGSWKQRHPSQKFNMATLGQLWKAMTLSEKEPYESEYRQRRKAFEDYQALLQLSQPALANRENAKLAFPLSRIRAIMRQDPAYAPKTEAYSAMARAAQYFADYLLEEVKRMSEGKNRIDHRLLYQCINNQRSLSFLDCLIEEHNLENLEPRDKKNRPEVRLEMEAPPKNSPSGHSHNNMINKGDNHNSHHYNALSSRVDLAQQHKAKPVAVVKPQSHKAASGAQMSLDSFFSKNR